MNKTALRLKFNFCLALIFCFAISVSAQDKKNDSLNNSALLDYKNIVDEAQLQRQKDSLEKVHLELRINSLSTTDNRKKQQLENQLQELKQKDSLRLVEKKKAIDIRRKAATGYPVIGFFKDTLFTIYNNSGSFTAHDRALAVSERIRKLGEELGTKEIEISTIKNESTIDISHNEQILISISENDALWNDTTTTALAEKYRKKIKQHLQEYRSETSLSTLLKEFGLAILVLVILGLILYYTTKLFKFIARKIELQKGKRIKGVKIKDYLLFDERQQVKTLLVVNNLMKWVVILILISIALPILFGIFPWTRDFAETLFGYILNPVKKIAFSLWNYLPNLITILVIVTVFRYVMKGLSFLKEEVANGRLTLSGFYPDWANPTFQILRILLYAFLLVVIFPYLPGSDSEIFKGVSVFLGFLFTFGSAGSLSNLIAGLVLTYMRLFRIGDRVKIGEATGDVVEKSMLVTRIRTLHNEIISIPNSTVMSSHTINYSSESLDKGLILHTTITIGYDVPWNDVHQALLQAANRTDLILKDPKPFVLQTALEDFYVAYEINAYSNAANQQATIYSNLRANIQDCCNEAGIEIMSPHYRAERDGNLSTIPSKYSDKTSIVTQEDKIQ